MAARRPGPPSAAARRPTGRSRRAARGRAARARACRGSPRRRRRQRLGLSAENAGPLTARNRKPPAPSAIGQRTLEVERSDGFPDAVTASTERRVAASSTRNGRCRPGSRRDRVSRPTGRPMSRPERHPRFRRPVRRRSTPAPRRAGRRRRRRSPAPRPAATRNSGPPRPPRRPRRARDVTAMLLPGRRYPRPRR